MTKLVYINKENLEIVDVFGVDNRGQVNEVIHSRVIGDIYTGEETIIAYKADFVRQPVAHNYEVDGVDRIIILLPVSYDINNVKVVTEEELGYRECAIIDTFFKTQLYARKQLREIA